MEPDQEPESAALTRAIRAYQRDVAPERDLWPGIERRIAQARPGPRGWQQWVLVAGVAASLLMATASLVLVMRNEPRTLVQSAAKADAEYVGVREGLLRTFRVRSAHLDPVTLEQVHRNLAIIERARKEIQQALVDDPQNDQLVEILIRLQQQEIGVLTQRYGNGNHSI